MDDDKKENAKKLSLVSSKTQEHTLNKYRMLLKGIFWEQNLSCIAQIKSLMESLEDKVAD